MQELNVGELWMDIRNRKSAIRGKDVALTPKEFDLLALLADDSPTQLKGHGSGKKIVAWNTKPLWSGAGMNSAARDSR